MSAGKKILSAFLSLSIAAVMSASAVLPAFADAGEKPPPIKDGEKVFPDPDSFSYDDVEINFAKALQYTLYFYDANKCGSGEKYLEWRSDCHTEDETIPLKPMGEDYKGTNLSEEFIEKYKDLLDPDGNGTIDCSGGMHDAGDHVKFCLPGSYAASTVGWGYYEFRDAYVDTGNQWHIEDILHWFNDFYMKSTYLDENGKVVAYCYQVGEGKIDHNYWNAPELQNENLLDFARPAYFATVDTPASDMCAGTAASLAINYLNFKDTEPEYAAESLKKAIALYDFAVETHSENEKEVTSLGYDGGFYDSSYDYDELAWAAVWLYECTGNYDYITDIVKVDEETLNEKGAHPYTGYLKRIISDTGNCWQNIWVHCWDTVWGGVFAKLAPITNTERDWYIFRWNLEYWSGITHLYPGMDDVIWNKEYVPDTQPLRPEATDYLAQTPAGFSMLNEYGSARYNTAAELCAVVYAKYSQEKENDPMRFAKWAEGQMEYIMGKNPMNRAYIVGYSETAASHPHHRASHGSKTLSAENPVDQVHVLWGALVGGPDSSDWHRDITNDYIYNEVAVDYNAGIVGACAGLYHYFGTEDMKPTENFPPTEESMKGEIKEFNLKAAVGQEDDRATQVLIEIDNSAFLPPRYLDDIKVRYYFSIAELLEHGQTLKDLELRIDYDTMKSNSNGDYEVACEVVQYSDKGDCYLEMTWSDYDFYGKLQFQFALVAPNQTEDFVTVWDPTNDYSRSKLSTCDELGCTLGEALVDYDLLTMEVDGKYILGTAPEGAPAVGTDNPNPPTAMYGDVNDDGKITIADLVMLARYIAEDEDMKPITEQGLINADCDGVKGINGSDMTALARYLAHLITASQLGPQTTK